MAKPLKEYHFAWLSSHPERTTDWLRFMLKAGFDIHHLDGDHGNNDPKNLVLIEHRDHMRLHGASSGFGRELEVSKRRRQERFLSEGKLAYETALVVLQTATFASGIWVETGRKSGLGHKAQCRAALWAKANDLEWPLWRPGTVGWALKQQAKGA
jgi:hypothetical protein